MAKLLSCGLLFLLLVSLPTIYASSSSDSGSSSSSSNSNSGDSSSSDDNDCNCNDLSSQLASLEARLNRMEATFEIEQLVTQLAYRFDDFVNDISTFDVYADFVRNNSISELKTLVGDLFQFDSVDEFISAFDGLNENNFYYNHFNMPGTMWFVELTDTYANVRQNLLVENIQLAPDFSRYQQDNTWEIIEFEFEKVNDKWLFTLINSFVTYGPCIVGSEYDTTTDECLVDIDDLL